MRSAHFLVAALFTSLLIVCNGSSAQAAGLQAGAYAMDVTPQKFPISVNGGMSDRMINRANDPLHARCLVIDDGKTKLAFVVVDSCMIPRELMTDAKNQASKKTGIPASNILISATHTHSAPTVTGVFQSDPDEGYVRYLAEKIAGGIEQAHKNLQPAKIGWAVGKDDTQLFNRRWKRNAGLIPANPFGDTTDQVQMNPGHQATGLTEQAGPTDPEVSVLAVQSKAGKPIAALVNYSLHYVGGYPDLSADYYGAFAERLTALATQDKNAPEKGDPAFVAILSNGTSGDVNNVNFAAAPLKRGPGEQIRIVAESVAKNAWAAYQKIVWKEEITLAVAEKDIELAVRKPNAKELERAQKLLDEQKGKPSLVGMPAIYARESVLLAKYPDKVPVKLQTMRIGELGIAAIPCEVFTEIGLQIKKESPFKPTFTISLANGYNGYLPTPAQHKLGGYETWRARSSYLETPASDKIVATLFDLFKQVTPKTK